MNTLADKALPLQQLFGAPETDNETLDLVRYWRAIAHSKWRILVLAIAVGILATMVANSLRSTYRATAVVLIESNKPKLVSIEEVYSQLSTSSISFYQTQAEILKSRELAIRLVRRLKLTEDSALDPRQRPSPYWQEWFPQGWFNQGPKSSPSPGAIEASVVSSVMGGLSVVPIRNSQLIRISFESGDSELSARVPNALAELYIEADLEARMTMTQKATSWLTGQSADLRKKLTEAEQALQQFREREKIIDAKGLAQSGATKQLEDLQNALNQARTRRVEAEINYSQVSAVLLGKSQESLESLPALQKNQSLAQARAQEAEAEKRLNEVSKRYGAEHPRMVAAEADLKTAKENVRRQVSAASQAVTREFEVAKASETINERNFNAVRADIQNLNRKEFQLASLEREVATSRQFYDMFVQRFKETNISTDMQSAIARVIDPATPGGPSGPNRQRIVLIAVAIALLLGAGLALLIERLNNTLKTSHDVESKLGVPVLGILQITKVKRGQQLERVFLEDPQSSFSESIRTIRSGVMLSSLDSPKKIVVITSSIPEEGKTTVAINLAFALGQVKKTLLIDADMRRPRIGKVLGGKSNASLLGLSQLVSGEAPLEKCIYPVNETNLHVLPAGRVPPNPLELLSSHRFSEVIDQLGKIFDVILIDSPPTQLVSDALVLSNIATEVVYVVKADDTPYPLARVGIKRLRRVNAPIVGVVLNQLDVEKADRYYGEYSGYGKRYYGKYGKKYGYGYGPTKT
jgi:succinoglycan biosynthesis transport protein ExoP